MCMPNFIELAQIEKKVMAGEPKRRENEKKEQKQKEKN